MKDQRVQKSQDTPLRRIRQGVGGGVGDSKDWADWKQELIKATLMEIV